MFVAYKSAKLVNRQLASFRYPFYDLKSLNLLATTDLVKNRSFFFLCLLHLYKLLEKLYAEELVNSDIIFQFHFVTTSIVRSK